MTAARGRPQSWYGVAQPYTRQLPGEQPPLPPGAPDFPPPPPCSASPGTAAGDSSVQHHPHQPIIAGQYSSNSIQRSPSPNSRRFSQVNGNPQGNFYVASQVHPHPHTEQAWQPGHHSSYSQPIVPSYAMAHPIQADPQQQAGWDVRAPLSDQIHTPARPVSPRPMLPPGQSQPYRQATLPEPIAGHGSPIPRMHSPQPRRNTLPSPVVLDGAASNPSWQQSPHQPAVVPTSPTNPIHSQSPIPSTSSFTSSASTLPRRALPRPPSGPSPSSSPIPSLSSAPSGPPSTTASPALPANLSRSSSVASNASAGSTGSIRRPLPRPPLPSVPDTSPRAARASPVAGVSHPPASCSQAQAEISGSGPDGRSSLNGAPVPFTSEPASDLANGRSEEPFHVRSLQERMAEASIGQSREPTNTGNASVKEAPVPPSIQVPTFSFGDDDGNNAGSGAGPSISISVAPPSPSLSKATSHDAKENYFDSPLPPDEGLPLPSCSVPMATSTEKKGYALACPGCDKPVLYGRTVSAMGKRWHPDCLKCAHCALKLEHFEFFTKDGNPYCHVDYHELFSIRCSHCKTPIVDESYITIDDPALPGQQRSYHELHFFCANCGDPFIDPKSRGSALGSSDEGPPPKPFTVHKGHAYCENCNEKLYKTKCSNCRKPIQGDVLRALNRNWCEDCFRCDMCSNGFEAGTFLVWQGKPHCEDCYKIRLRSEV